MKSFRQPPQKSLATIHGTFHVIVKVQVDAAGNVVNSSLGLSRPQPLFAGLAEKPPPVAFSGAEERRATESPAFGSFASNSRPPAFTHRQQSAP